MGKMKKAGSAPLDINSHKMQKKIAMLLPNLKLNNMYVGIHFVWRNAYVVFFMF